jgi:hypothetical protein
MTTHNPTQHPQPEPAWIRDCSAMPEGEALMLEVGDVATVAQLLEGEKAFCGFCGKEFALYPLSECAEHALAEHKDEMTLQGEQTFRLQCVPGLTQHLATMVQALFSMRVSLRRRAWHLGLAKSAPQPRQQGPLIHLPGGRRREN